jgi:predicted MFS family arabinose efflux permease
LRSLHSPGVGDGAVLLAVQDSLAGALLASVLWGIAFGGAATHLQTAMNEATGENADVANAMLTTSFSLAIFAGGALDAVVIEGARARMLPTALIVLALLALVVAGCGRRAAFP